MTESTVDVIDFGFIRIRGLLRDLVLYSIAKLGKAHGYAIRSFLSEALKIYVPSSGVLYPTLHELEEQGFVKSFVEGRRKVYTLTEKGSEYISSRISEIEKTVARIRRAVEIAEYIGLKELLEILKELWELGIEPPKNVIDAVRDRVREINSILRAVLKSSNP
ncbi:MAG: PadR family transcriptional regulator [Ignisphaera sp.]|nr:PadR family transcriptional regulator [Ignisphaera sp.]